MSLVKEDYEGVADTTQESDAEALPELKCRGRWEIGKDVVEGDYISYASLQAYKAECTIFRQKFDDIFDDVERNLPTIHFDGSDQEVSC